MYVLILRPEYEIGTSTVGIHVNWTVFMLLSIYVVQTDLSSPVFTSLL